jgi:hypothetical protein
MTKVPPGTSSMPSTRCGRVELRPSSAASAHAPASRECSCADRSAARNGRAATGATTHHVVAHATTKHLDHDVIERTVRDTVSTQRSRVDASSGITDAALDPITRATHPPAMSDARSVSFCHPAKRAPENLLVLRRRS